VSPVPVLGSGWKAANRSQQGLKLGLRLAYNNLRLLPPLVGPPLARCTEATPAPSLTWYLLVVHACK
jgi:hypothetical protein